MASNDTWQDNSWPFSDPYQGFANQATQDGIVTAIGAGVFPPYYRTNAHYLFHHRMGQNVRCAPILLPIDDRPQTDLNYPAHTNEPSLLAMNPPPTTGEYWLLEKKQPTPQQQIFGPLDAPPAPPNSPPWTPL